MFVGFNCVVVMFGQSIGDSDVRRVISYAITVVILHLLVFTPCYKLIMDTVHDFKLGAC